MITRMKEQISASTYNISERNKSHFDELISSLAEKSKEYTSIWNPMAACNVKMLDAGTDGRSIWVYALLLSVSLSDIEMNA